MNNIQMTPVSLFQKEIPTLSNGSIRTTNQLSNPMSVIKSPEAKPVKNSNLRPLLEINPFLKESHFQRQEYLHQICNQNSFGPNNEAATNLGTNLRPLFEINPFMKDAPIQIRPQSFDQSCNQLSFEQNHVNKLGAGIGNSANNNNLRPLFEINPFIKGNPVQERQDISHLFKDTSLQPGIRNQYNQHLFQQNSAERCRAESHSVNNNNLKPLFEVNPFIKENHMQVRPEARQDAFPQQSNASLQRHSENCRQLDLFWQKSINRFGPAKTSNNSNVRPLLEVSTSKKDTQLKTEHEDLNQSKANISFSIGATSSSSINHNLVPIKITENSGSDNSLAIIISSDSSPSNGKKRPNDNLQDAGPHQKRARHKHKLKKNARRKLRINRIVGEKQLPFSSASAVSKAAPVSGTSSAKVATVGAVDKVPKERETGNDVTAPVVSSVKEETPATDMEPRKKIRIIFKKPVVPVVSSVATVATTLTIADMESKEKMISNKPTAPVVSSVTTVPPTLMIADMEQSEGRVSNTPAVPVVSSVEKTVATDIERQKRVRMFLKKPTVPVVSTVATTAPAQPTPATVGRKPNDTKIVTKSTISSANDLHCKVCNKSYKLRNHDNKDGEVISYHLFEINHLENTLALHDSVTLRSRKYNFGRGLETSKNKTRTISKYRRQLVNAVKAVEKRFIQYGKIPPNEVKTVVMKRLPATVGRKPNDTKIVMKSTISTANDLHCKVCNKSYKLRNHDNKDGEVISYHLFEISHLENTLALHDSVTLRSKKYNFSRGLETSKNKTRTISKYRRQLVNAVKAVEKRFIQYGQIPPNEVKTVVMSNNKAMSNAVYCKLCDCDFYVESSDYDKHAKEFFHLIRTMEKHRPGLARKLYYKTEVNAADFPRFFKRRRFVIAVRAALEMVKSDFEKRNLPIPNEIPPAVKPKRKDRGYAHDFLESDDSLFQWTQDDPIKVVDKLFSDMNAAFEKLMAARAQNSSLELAAKSSTKVYPFDGLLRREEFACFLSKDELITTILERRKKMPGKVAQSDSLSTDAESLHPPKRQENLPAQVNGSEMSQGRKSYSASTPKKMLSSEPGSLACSKEETLLHQSNASVSVKKISIGTQTVTDPQPKLNKKEGLLPTPILPHGNIQMKDLHKAKGLLPTPTNSIAKENYFRRREGSLLPLPTDNVLGYSETARNNLDCSETYSRIEKLQQKVVNGNRKRKHAQDLVEESSSNTTEKSYETDKICRKQTGISDKKAGTQQCVQEQGTNATSKPFLSKPIQENSRNVREDGLNAKGETLVPKLSNGPHEEDLDGTSNKELHRTKSAEKDKQTIERELESSDESIDDWKEIPVQRNSRRNHHNDETFDYGHAEKADERENQMCPQDVNNCQFNSSFNANSNSPYQYQVSREDITDRRQSQHYDLSAKREALLTTLNTLKTCLITNEEEADMAWQISFSLTEALLQYRRGQKPNS